MSRDSFEGWKDCDRGMYVWIFSTVNVRGISRSDSSRG